MNVNTCVCKLIYTQYTHRHLCADSLFAAMNTVSWCFRYLKLNRH